VNGSTEGEDVIPGKPVYSVALEKDVMVDNVVMAVTFDRYVFLAENVFEANKLDGRSAFNEFFARFCERDDVVKLSIKRGRRLTPSYCTLNQFLGEEGCDYPLTECRRMTIVLSWPNGSST
jgi:hypothetical protein